MFQLKTELVGQIDGFMFTAVFNQAQLTIGGFDLTDLDMLKIIAE